MKAEEDSASLGFIFLTHQLHVQQFSSDTNNSKLLQSPGVKAYFHKTLKANCKYQCFWSAGYKFAGSHNPLLGFSNLLTELR